jgi:hypothetical protein
VIVKMIVEKQMENVDWQGKQTEVLGENLP